MLHFNHTPHQPGRPAMFRIILTLLAALTFAPGVTNAQVEDVTPPTLLDFSFTPTVIDTTNGSQQVTVTVRASDDLSGVASAADTCFQSASGIQYVCGVLYSEVSRSGIPEVVTFEGAVSFSQFAESGPWRVLGVSLTDRAGNVRFFTTADLQAEGLNTQLEVVSIQDVTPPALLDFSFTPTVIDTTNGSQQVTVTVRASDDLSGVASAADTCFQSPSGIQYVCGVLYSEVSRSGIPEVVTFEGGFTFPQFAESGSWHVLGVSLTDRARNVRFFNTADLQGARFPVELINALQRIQVRIDIKPGGDPNSVNLSNKGVIPVAVLTTDTFDATAVDSTTVRFGATGTEAAAVQSATEDVDGDGDIDLILHFNTRDTGIVCGSTTAFLAGQTLDSQPIKGSDFIRTVRCK